MKHSILLLIWLFISSGFSQAQTLSQAKILYTKGEFKKAIPAFKEGLQAKPKDPSLNLWYGVCLFETGNIEASFSYLNFAENKRLPEASHYLAKYYLKSLSPDTALIFIDKYLENTKISAGNKEKGLLVKASIESCMEQLQHVEDICFIDSVVLQKKDLFSAVALTEEAGKIVLVHTAFKDVPLSSGYAYFPERNDRVYYANKYPEKGLDIVARHRVINDWGTIEPLSDVINTEADECNPYFLSDGVTLYFASNGHGSIGGYDLFVTRLNQSSNTFLVPDHLNMPFNSTANDFFLIIDEFANRGYLATDRNQPEGYVTIYTFIPNKIKTLIQGKSFTELQNFAQISSIKATQIGKNLDSLLQKSEVPVLTVKEDEPDAIFVINDSLRYSQVSDFKSEDARKQYIEYRTLFQKYTKGKKVLEEKRAQYLEATIEDQRKLGAEILLLEADVIKTQRDLPVMEKRVRNLEISKLLK